MGDEARHIHLDDMGGTHQGKLTVAEQRRGQGGGAPVTCVAWESLWMLLAAAQAVISRGAAAADSAWHGCQCTRIDPQPVAHWELSSNELAGYCVVEGLPFSRVGPVHMAHGGAWAQLEAPDSRRSPCLMRR